MQSVLRDDVVRYLDTPARPPIPRDPALVRVVRPWPVQVWRRLARAFRRAAPTVVNTPC